MFLSKFTGKKTGETHLKMAFLVATPIFSFFLVPVRLALHVFHFFSGSFQIVYNKGHILNQNIFFFLCFGLHKSCVVYTETCMQSCPDSSSIIMFQGLQCIFILKQNKEKDKGRINN